MATATDKPRASQTTQVTDMPPLRVTAEGIPAREHLATPPPQTGGGRAAQRRRDRITWTVAAVVVLLFLGATVVLNVIAPAGVHMGLSSWAWSQYRAGERVAVSVETTAPVAPSSPFTGPPMTAVQPLGAVQPPYVG